MWEIEQLRRLAIRLEERIDDLYWFLRERRPALLSTLAGDGIEPSRLRTRRAPLPAIAPAVWATKLATQQRPDGSLLVSVNGKAPFVLQPHLAALLLALADDTGLSRDEGVAFKTLRDLSVRIGKRTGGRAPATETVNKYVHKLRKLLSRKGLPADLIQTNRRLGRRLALKRSSRVA